jgi:hypothetical protein
LRLLRLLELLVAVEESCGVVVGLMGLLLLVLVVRLVLLGQ